MPKSNSREPQASKRFLFIDTETGERFRANITPERRGLGGRWVRVFQDTMQRLAERHPELHGQSYRVLAYLTGVAAWNNALPSTGVVAVALGLQPSAVRRAYGELSRVEVILRRDSVYYLSPLVAWKGTERQLEAACQELYGIGIGRTDKSLPGAGGGV